MKDFYAYIRVSTTKQGEQGSSLQEQRAAIVSYASRHSLTISQWFEEQETAAKRGRTVFTQMLAALEKHRAAGVIIHKIDRSARNLRDWADLGEMIDRGIEVHFAHESLDLHSRSGRLSADIQAVVAADYIRNLRDEVLKGFYGRLKQGYYPMRAPIGYVDKGGGQAKEPDPVMAPLVFRAFELYARGGYTIELLREEMSMAGLRNRTGKRVSINGMSHILNNPFYTGIIKLERTGQTFQGNHRPIVPKSLFEQVQSMLARHARNSGFKHDFLYRRFVRCASCNYYLIPERQKGHVYYRCQKKHEVRTCMREERVDQELRREIERLRMSEEEIQMVWHEFQRLDSTSAREKQEKELNLGLAAINTRIERTTDALVDGLISKESFGERHARLLEERATLREQLANVQDEVGFMAKKRESFLELIKIASSRDEMITPAEIRRIAEKAASNVIAQPNRVELAWVQPFATVALTNADSNGEPHRGGTRTQETIQKIAREIDEHIEKDDVVVPEDLEKYRMDGHKKRYWHSYKMVKEFNQKKRR